MAIDDAAEMLPENPPKGVELHSERPFLAKENAARGVKRLTGECVTCFWQSYDPKINSWWGALTPELTNYLPLLYEAVPEREREALIARERGDESGVDVNSLEFRARIVRNFFHFWGYDDNRILKDQTEVGRANTIKRGLYNPTGISVFGTMGGFENQFWQGAEEARGTFEEVLERFFLDQIVKEAGGVAGKADELYEAVWRNDPREGLSAIHRFAKLTDYARMHARMARGETARKERLTGREAAENAAYRLVAPRVEAPDVAIGGEERRRLDEMRRLANFWQRERLEEMRGCLVRGEAPKEMVDEWLWDKLLKEGLAVLRFENIIYKKGVGVVETAVVVETKEVVEYFKSGKYQEDGQLATAARELNISAEEAAQRSAAWLMADYETSYFNLRKGSERAGREALVEKWKVVVEQFGDALIGDGEKVRVKVTDQSQGGEPVMIIIDRSVAKVAFARYPDEVDIQVVELMYPRTEKGQREVSGRINLIRRMRRCYSGEADGDEPKIKPVSSGVEAASLREIVGLVEKVRPGFDGETDFGDRLVRSYFEDFGKSGLSEEYLETLAKELDEFLVSAESELRRWETVERVEVESRTGKKRRAWFKR